MDKAKIDKMSGMFNVLLLFAIAHFIADQQIGQLYELMQAIQKQADEDSEQEKANIVGTLDDKSKPSQ